MKLDKEMKWRGSSSYDDSESSTCCTSISDESSPDAYINQQVKDKGELRVNFASPLSNTINIPKRSERENQILFYDDLELDGFKQQYENERLVKSDSLWKVKSWDDYRKQKQEEMANLKFVPSNIIQTQRKPVTPTKLDSLKEASNLPLVRKSRALRHLKVVMT